MASKHCQEKSHVDRHTPVRNWGIHFALVGTTLLISGSVWHKIQEVICHRENASCICAVISYVSMQWHNYFIFYNIKNTDMNKPKILKKENSFIITVNAFIM